MDLTANFTHPSQTVVSAHAVCRIIETEAKKKLESATNSAKSADIMTRKKQLADVRVLGYLLSEGTDAAKEHVAKSIHSVEPSGDVDKIIELGSFFFKYFIMTFRRAGNRTPAHTEHLSRTSSDNAQDAIEALITPAPRNHSQAKDNALCRDGFRCVISRRFDLVHTAKWPDVEGRQYTTTQCAHIIPETLNFDLENPNRADHVTNVWTVLEYFGHENLHQELSGEDIHNLGNVLTLDAQLHALFDDLRVWLEPTDTPHRYHFRHALIRDPKAFGYEIPECIQLETPDQARLPLPNPAYLSLHASCCRIARLSGAAEFLDWVDSSEDSLDSAVPTEDFSASLTARLLLLDSQSPFPRNTSVDQVMAVT